MSKDAYLKGRLGYLPMNRNLNRLQAHCQMAEGNFVSTMRQLKLPENGGVEIKLDEFHHKIGEWTMSYNVITGYTSEDLIQYIRAKLASIGEFIEEAKAMELHPTVIIFH